MANPSQGSSAADPRGSGLFIIVVVAVVLGMFLMNKKAAESADPVADAGPGAGSVSGDPVLPSAQPRPTLPKTVPPVGRQNEPGKVSVDRAREPGVIVPHRNKPLRKMKNEPLSIKDVVSSQRMKSKGVTNDKINRTGEWAIEEVPLGNNRDGIPQPKPDEVPEGAELKKTTKGDWVIEEAGGNTKPAAELKLSDPSEPKATKKGDWELEVD